MTERRGKKRNVIQYAAIVTIALILPGCRTSAEVVSEPPPIPEIQNVFKQPLLQFKTPGSLDFCGESVPLERREVWERLDKQFLFALNREAQVILWLKRSRQYFPYIEEELKKRGLPDDLKYLAVAESDLNKYALSPSGAAGTWQFMKQTGTRFGLAREEWTDQRYSFVKSTAAALNYLSTLHEQFGKWMLAAAAYNCGEERLAREIEEQNTEQYVDLSLPKETEEYLFRIMAIKIILSNPAQYGFMLEESECYLPGDAEEVEITLPGMFHMRIIAEAAKTNYRTIKELNPDLRGYYLPEGNHRLFIPGSAVEGFNQRLSASLAEADKGMRTIHIVRKGDTLSGIAKRLDIPLEKLLQWNDIAGSEGLNLGQKLIYYRPYEKQ